MNFVKVMKEWLYSFIVSFALSIFINVFFFQPILVEGHSMDPTLRNQEYIFLSKLSHTMGRTPEYGDIVIIDSRVNRTRSLTDDLTDPVNNIISLAKGSPPEYFFVKRIIGKQGDTLEFKDGLVYRNGTALNEPYIKERMKYTSARKIVVPENNVFVLGDNRNNSLDSRYIGSIPVSHIMGVMLFGL